MEDKILQQIIMAADNAYLRYLTRENANREILNNGQDKEIYNGLFTDKQYSLDGSEFITKG